MKPSVGRIVHYIPEWLGGNPPVAIRLPAIIIGVGANEECIVGVFSAGGYYSARAKHLPDDREPYTPGCWLWPPRESKF